MNLKILRSFAVKLAQQVEFIATDKPEAAHKFKTEILLEIQKVSKMPYSCRKSIYFKDKDIRDLVYKGYVIVYRVKPNENCIEIFGFVHKQRKP